MNKIVRIGIVGSPQSGKTSLIEYLRNYLKKDYQVVIADEPPTILLKAGLNPPYNISGLDFQIKCLDEYVNVYKRIDSFMAIFKEVDKPIVILYDTLPSLGQCYLKGKNNEGFEDWKHAYDKYEEIFRDHEPDKIFITELLNIEYSSKGNAVRRDLEVQKILSIDEKMHEVYKGSTTLPSNYSIEERAGEVAEYIESFFAPAELSVSDMSSVTYFTDTIKATVLQHCRRCHWHDLVDCSSPYNYCPMCGCILDFPVDVDDNGRGGSLDPLGEEARRKMFYVDPSTLPMYTSTLSK